MTVTSSESSIEVSNNQTYVVKQKLYANKIVIICSDFYVDMDIFRNNLGVIQIVRKSHCGFVGSVLYAQTLLHVPMIHDFSQLIMCHVFVAFQSHYHELPCALVLNASAKCCAAGSL